MHRHHGARLKRGASSGSPGEELRVHDQSYDPNDPKTARQIADLLTQRLGRD
jgi:hypothetical protein